MIATIIIVWILSVVFTTVFLYLGYRFGLKLAKKSQFYAILRPILDERLKRLKKLLIKKMAFDFIFYIAACPFITALIIIVILNMLPGFLFKKAKKLFKKPTPKKEINANIVLDTVKKIHDEWNPTFHHPDFLIIYRTCLNATDFASYFHQSLGMDIRNKFELWKGENELCQYFKSQGITHADDMSYVILKELYNYIKNTDAQKEAEKATTEHSDMPDDSNDLTSGNEDLDKIITHINEELPSESDFFDEVPASDNTPAIETDNTALSDFTPIKTESLTLSVINTSGRQLNFAHILSVSHQSNIPMVEFAPDTEVIYKLHAFNGDEISHPKSYLQELIANAGMLEILSVQHQNQPVLYITYVENNQLKETSILCNRNNFIKPEGQFGYYQDNIPQENRQVPFDLTSRFALDGSMEKEEHIKIEIVITYAGN